MIHTIEQAKRRHAATGGHWFATGAMRFFNTRISGKVHPVPDGMLFVTSERPDSYSLRRYSVRFISDSGEILTFGEFQGWASASGAHAAAKTEQRKRFGGLTYAEWMADQLAAEPKLCSHGYVIGQDSCPCCDADE